MLQEEALDGGEVAFASPAEKIQREKPFTPEEVGRVLDALLPGRSDQAPGGSATDRAAV